MNEHKILVLRPYGPRIRNRMFAALGELGLEPQQDDVIASELDDAEIVERLRDESTGILLCPYNNMRLENGQITNGLRLLQRIEKEGMSQFQHTPILMPVSVFSAPVFNSEVRQGTDMGRPGDQLMARILVIQEDELDDREALTGRIRAHIGVAVA